MLIIKGEKNPFYTVLLYMASVNSITPNVKRELTDYVSLNVIIKH